MCNWQNNVLMIAMSLATAAIAVNKGTTKNDVADKDQQLLIVSTVDGKISALDVQNQGKLLWSNQYNAMPLISTSISKLDYVENGKTIRLIPTLHRGLFKCLGNVLEAYPFDVNQLSIQLTTNYVLTNDNEICYTTIVAFTGSVVQSCCGESCEKLQFFLLKNNETVLLLKRVQQKVVLVRKGTIVDTWNYYVGEVSLNLLKQNPSSMADLMQQSVASAKSDNTENRINCSSNHEHSQLKVIVPNGTVYKTSVSNQENLDWKNQFDSPIAAVWTLKNGKIQAINILDKCHNPALEDNNTSALSSVTNVIYLGAYLEQVYIQTSASVNKNIKQAVFSSFFKTLLPKSNLPNFILCPCFSPSQNASLLEKKSNIYAKNLKSASNDVLQTKRKTFCRSDSELNRGYYFQNGLAICSKTEKNICQINPIPSDKENNLKNKQGDKSLIILTTIIIILTAIGVAIVIYFNKGCYLNKNNTNSESEQFLPKSCKSQLMQQFDIISVLGQGGYGTVFKVKRKSDGVTFAVKYVKLPTLASKKDKTLRELSALSQLQHLHIVKLFHSWFEPISLELQNYLNQHLENISENSQTHTSASKSMKLSKSNNCLLMQMELCDHNLRTWLIDNSSRSRTEYLELFRQILSALKFIHEREFIHRDIKPSNILLLKNVVKVGDFGLVKPLYEACDKYLSTDTLLTLKLDMYMAPELKYGKTRRYIPTCKVDIFSLGLIFFEMVQRCKTESEVFYLLPKVRDLKFPVNFYVEHPEEFKIIQSMLQLEPASRPTAAEILNYQLLNDN